jgi:arabinofuranosyltransferase
MRETVRRFPVLPDYVVPALALLLFAWIAIVTAWLSDDSLISLRQVFHAINGQGFTWNYGVRVQAFTHPAWVVLLTIVSSITRELYVTAIALSIALSLAAVCFVVAYARCLPRGRCTPFFLYGFLLTLAFSKAFTDYMTSGLENALSFFLVGFALWQIGKLENGDDDGKRLALVFGLLALAFLNRFDHALLLLPLSIYVLLAHVDKRQLRALVPGVSMIVAWFSFSLFYFGAPFPNTYYAKLVTGFPAAEVHERAAAYFVVSLTKDPVTAALIVCGAVAGLLGRNWINRSLSLGGLLYAAYIFNAGGDFMQGRFFAILTYIAVFNVISIDETVKPRRAFKAAVLLVSLSMAAIGPKPVLSDATYRDVSFTDGVADERGVWYEPFGLLSERRRWPEMPTLSTRRPVEYGVTCAGGDGFTRSEIFLIDLCGLTDPLLARLPAVHAPDWRIGHHFRKVPTDYGNFLVGRVAGIQDAQLQELLDDLMLVVSGPLFSGERLAAIVRLNAPGGYAFDRAPYADPAIHMPRSTLVTRVEWSRLDRAAPADGTRWFWPLPEGVWAEMENVATMFDRGLEIIVQPARLARRISLSVDGNDDYRVTINTGQMEFIIEAQDPSSRRGGLFSHVIELPEPVRVVLLRVVPIRGDGVYAIGHLAFDND